MNDPAYHWNLGKRTLKRGSLPLLMGILNTTPDSFSDGGSYMDLPAAVEHALKLEAEGADILDIGGESTRPGSVPVSLDEEYQRIIPLVEALSGKLRIPISVDTTKSIVAQACLERGVEIINDISGLTFDSKMPEVCAKFQCGIVCMHIQGTPQTMQLDPHYEDCIHEIRDWLSERLRLLKQAGIKEESIILDPGIGFGKTAQHNLEILSSIKSLHELNRPVLIGHSRKRFLGKILERPIEERLMGTVGVSLALAQQNVDVIRLHDIKENKEALLAFHAVLKHER